jgi:2-dehydro-3-deoxygluconokinase
VSQLHAGDVDWAEIFECEGARWFHSGGIFAGLSETTAGVLEEAMTAAKAAGTVVSYDLNFRPSLWKRIGGAERAVEVNRRLARLVEVMFGNEEDFTAALGYEVVGTGESFAQLDTTEYAAMLDNVARDFPNLKVIATSLRAARSATSNDWGGICWAGGRIVETEPREQLEILDRVGGGDSFASGLIYGFLEEMPVEKALEYGVAHGALAMTTPGDTSMATLAEVKQLVAGAGARIQR